MNVLVTGGAGYIGSVVVARLLEAGHEVTVIDDLSTGHRDAVPDGARFVFDRVQQVSRALGLEAFDSIVHLAASSLVAESITDPQKYETNNVAATRHLLDAQLASGISKIVFSSSAAIYGEPVRVPIEEDAPAMPLNPYGASKLAVDRMLGEAAARHGIAAVSLRYFNVAGSYSTLGERHDPETHLIPLTLRAALEGRPVDVFGDDYPTPDGTCIRDYIHVVDIADAHLLALGAATPGTRRVYNLGNGEGFSVRQVIATARRVTGLQLAERVTQRRAGDPAVLVASSGRARRELGWNPKRPELDQMVHDAWHFLQRSQT
ncbi:MAG: UDP-glucose 4-epimerase GalE [Acidimicrobiales bacterium]